MSIRSLKSSSEARQHKEEEEEARATDKEDINSFNLYGLEWCCGDIRETGEEGVALINSIGLFHKER